MYANGESLVLSFEAILDARISSGSISAGWSTIAKTSDET
jgi:hypothetical protein